MTNHPCNEAHSAIWSAPDTAPKQALQAAAPLPTAELLEGILRSSNPAHVATLLQVACLKLAKQTDNKLAKAELRASAKHYSHVLMSWLPGELATTAARQGGEK